MEHNKNIEIVREFPYLEKNIKKSKYKETPPLYKERKDHFSKFHILEQDDKLF